MTRVLKGCVKAAGWGMRDDGGEGGGRNEMSIKSQSKNIRVWDHHFVFFPSQTHRLTHKTSTQTHKIMLFAFGSTNQLI